MTCVWFTCKNGSIWKGAGAWHPLRSVSCFDLHHWSCKWCDIELIGNRIIRLKQHLAGSYSMYQCTRMPRANPTADEALYWFQSSEGEYLEKLKRVEVDHRAVEPPSYYSKMSEDCSIPIDEAQIKATTQASLDD